MRAALIALGSRGDTQPVVALGRGLRERGHDVVVVGPPRYADLVTGQQLGFAPLTIDPTTIMESPAGQELLASGPVGFVRGFRSVVGPLAATVVRDAAAGAAGADLVLAPGAGGLGRHLAEASGARHALLHFQPSEPTAAFPNPLLPRRSLGAAGNRGSYVAIEAATDLVLRSVQNAARRSELGLPPLRRSTFHLDRQARVPVLCGVSPLVQPRPADWPAHVAMTGSWSLGTRPATPLPAALEAFLAAGEPPVFVGFGSMVPPQPEVLAGQVADALRLAGVRGIVQGLPVRPTPELLAVDGDLDHGALFGRCAAVVHHGGAGTTATALRAGVPNVVVPFFSDQPYWAARVTALGCGPAGVPVKRLTTSRLAAAVRAAVTDVGTRRRAARLGRALRDEDGVGVACDLVGRL